MVHVPSTVPISPSGSHRHSATSSWGYHLLGTAFAKAATISWLTLGVASLIRTLTTLVRNYCVYRWVWLVWWCTCIIVCLRDEGGYQADVSHSPADRDQLCTHTFTFWEWFYKHLDLIKTTLRWQWVEEWVNDCSSIFCLSLIMSYWAYTVQHELVMLTS